MENLPFPIVEYPRTWSGAFPGFRRAKDCPVHFCHCQRLALTNYLTFLSRGIFSFESFGTQNFPRYLGPNEVEDSPSIETFIDSLKFGEKLCHQCNKRCPPPPLRWPTQTDSFATLFRHYISKVGFENGVSIHHKAVLPDLCSPAISEVLSKEGLARFLLLSNPSEKIPRKERTILREQWIVEFKKVEERIDLLARASFGFPTKGHRRISETILFLRTRSAFSETTVISQYRRKGLGGMSLDIFIPALSIGIEYQGDQHFGPISHWGGEGALRVTKERDARKREICQRLGIDLIYFEGDVTYESEGGIRRQIEAAATAKLLKDFNALKATQ